MTILEKYKLPITWSTVYYGLKNSFINLKESINLINASFDKLNCDEQLLVDLNVNEENREYIEKKISYFSDLEPSKGEKIWQLAFLLEIRNMTISEKCKLEKIANLWADFNYPEAWKSFIYYMPIKNSNSPFSTINQFPSNFNLRNIPGQTSLINDVPPNFTLSQSLKIDYGVIDGISYQNTHHNELNSYPPPMTKNKDVGILASFYRAWFYISDKTNDYLDNHPEVKFIATYGGSFVAVLIAPEAFIVGLATSYIYQHLYENYVQDEVKETLRSLIEKNAPELTSGEVERAVDLTERRLLEIVNKKKKKNIKKKSNLDDSTSEVRNSAAKPNLNRVNTAKKTGSASYKSLNVTDKEHFFTNIVDNYASQASKFKISGGDGISRSLYQLKGSLRGKDGVFEWIVHNGKMSHRRFIPNGKITGLPNQIPK